MGDEQLIGLALMQCHRQLVLNLNLDQLIEKFVRERNLRMAFINIFADYSG